MNTGVGGGEVRLVNFIERWEGRGVRKAELGVMIYHLQDTAVSVNHLCRATENYFLFEQNRQPKSSPFKCSA